MTVTAASLRGSLIARTGELSGNLTAARTAGFTVLRSQGQERLSRNRGR